MNIIKSLGIFTVGSISIAGGIVFITKHVITKVFDGFFEAYKLTLNKEIESFKINLQKQCYEHNVTFNKLHIERAEVIKNLYSHLVDMQSNLSIYAKFKKGNEDVVRIQKRVEISVDSFIVYANHNFIYFDDKICFNLKEIQAISVIILNLLGNNFDSRTAETTATLEALIKGLIDTEIPKFKNCLEKEFRNILGVY